MTNPPTEFEPAAADDALSMGTLSVLGAKGGVGTSVVAANLAYALSHERSMLLLDADEGRGGLRGLLDIDDPRSVERIYADPSRADLELLHGASVAIGERIRVLLQPDAFADVTPLNPDDVDAVVSLMGRSFDGVVRDEGCHVDRPTLRAVVRASRVLLVTTPDVLAVREARRMIDVLHEVDMLSRQIQVVVNDVHGQATLSREEIAALLGVGVVAELPHDRRLIREERHGGLVVAHAPQATWSKALLKLARTLSGEQAAAVSTGGFLSRTFGA